MQTNFDEKGKFFTQVITKKPIAVIIQTSQQLIRGEIHIRPDDRLKDTLDRENTPFLAVTNAVVLNAQQEELYRSSVMMINVSQIIWIIPDSEIAQAGTE